MYTSFIGVEPIYRQAGCLGGMQERSIFSPNVTNINIWNLLNARLMFCYTVGPFLLHSSEPWSARCKIQLEIASL